LSGVSDASGTSSVMFRSMGQRIGVALTNGDRVSAIRYGVVPNYFGTLSIPIVMGRPLLASDSPNGPAVAVISESLAQAAFHGESPLGKQLPLGIFGDPIEIVGVVGDVRHARLEEPPTPSFYIPIDQDSFSQTFWLLMRTSRTASSMAQSVRQIVQAADPAQPIETITSLQQVVEESFATRRFAAYTALAFSALAVLLAMAGMYGVVAQGVAERKNEIGVRLTLGATQRSIVGLILRSNARPVAVGVLLGILIALSCSRFFRGFLFGVPAADPVTISGTAVLLMLVCLAASCFPAIRAAREDPSHALRH
ncbi:MAG TPA: ABC transporter permease, partial [Vicinamibacterales bacterium]|nr:ABC transporter permease [Vicinamibacterales bacterium]